MWTDLLASRELAWRLMVRNLSAMYRQTMLGYIWAFLPPLFAAGTFIILQKGNLIKTAETTIPYAALTLIGTALWQVFVDGMNSPMRQVTQAKAMLTKINFPREALILAGIGETLVNFVIRLLIIIATLIWFQIPVTYHLLFVPFGVLLLISLGVMIGILLTPIAVLYQDIERGIPLLLPFLMLFSGAVLPIPRDGIGFWIAKLNPIAPVLETTRLWLTGQPSDLMLPFIWIAVAVVILLLVGWVLYRVAMPHLIARLGG